MRISKREVRIFLDEEGQRVIGLAAVDLAAPIYVRDTDDMGIWVRTNRDDGDHLILIRWDYVLCLDFRELENEVRF
jgi:hypothetical protein